VFPSRACCQVCPDHLQHFPCSVSTNRASPSPRESRCFACQPRRREGRYEHELQLHHACVIYTCQRQPVAQHCVFFPLLIFLLSKYHNCKHTTSIMASFRSSRTLLRRFARPAPPAFRPQSFTASLQRRSLASHQDATYPQVPYEKAESVGEKKFSQFDLDGKVFVVTGAACRPPPAPRASTMLLQPVLTYQQVEVAD
jgi:hypothetical protein